MTKVFVYGTLKRGHRNNFLLANSRFVSRGRTQKPFDMVSAGGFPVVLDGHRARVLGEVYEVSPEILVRLDELESNGRMYHRRKVAIDTPYDGKMIAWIYVGDDEYWRGNGRQCPRVEPAYSWAGS